MIMHAINRLSGAAAPAASDESLECHGWRARGNSARARGPPSRQISEISGIWARRGTPARPDTSWMCSNNGSVSERPEDLLPSRWPARPWRVGVSLRVRAWRAGKPPPAHEE